MVITVKNNSKNFGTIKIFTAYKELNHIIKKVNDIMNENLSEYITGAVPYSFTTTMRETYPETVEMVGKSYDLRTNVLDKLYNVVFFDSAREGQVKIWGQFNKKKKSLWINRKFINCPPNFDNYKVMLAKASGTGRFGEALSEPMILPPQVGHTQSYISVGAYNSKTEAENTCKYLKTKFMRTMLDIMKVTQDVTPSKFRYVPLQDFTPSSDIDWSQSISDIDKQLYRKYNLSDDEINFIESNVKEME